MREKKEKFVFCGIEETNKWFLSGILSVLLVLVLSGCSSTASSSSPKPTNSAASQASSPKNVPPFTGDGGKGIVIAVPAPTMKDATRTDNWMPQLFQDIITGDLARYSAMTVLDRSNEQIVLAEQSLSASGNYSDDDYIRIGNLTNAQYIVAGNILKVGTNYAVTFRINNTETNEIRASFNKTYPLRDIERGLASKEVIRELLVGMGIELTQAGETALLTIPETEVKATAQLAKGMAAEKSDNLVEALAFYTQAVGIAPGMKEAATHIQNFGGTIQTSSIRERAEQVQKEKEKWEKIFRDLQIYIQDNLPIIVYDFSTVKDTIYGNAVDLAITPGYKIVPNRTVLSVWKTVMDNWEQVKNREANKSWAAGGVYSNPLLYDVMMHLTTIGIISPGTDKGTGSLSIKIGLYDDYGDRIKTIEVGSGPMYEYRSSFQAVAQQKYYNDIKFNEIRFSNIKIDDLTDNLTPKIDGIQWELSKTVRTIHPLIMTVAEWEAWLREQQGK